VSKKLGIKVYFWKIGTYVETNLFWLGNNIYRINKYVCLSILCKLMPAKNNKHKNISLRDRAQTWADPLLAAQDSSGPLGDDCSPLEHRSGPWHCQNQSTQSSSPSVSTWLMFVPQHPITVNKIYITWYGF